MYAHITSLAIVRNILYNQQDFAQVVELVYTPVLGTGTERCGGSSPLLSTKKNLKYEYENI